MKIKFVETVLDGTPRKNDVGVFVQTVNVMSILTKDSGEEIRPMSDTIGVELTSDSISQSESDIEQAAKDFLDKKYSG